MIYVDIIFAGVGKVCEFACDGERPVRELCRQMAEALWAMEGLEPGREMEKYIEGLSLYSLDHSRMLAGDLALSDYQVCNGSRLLLISWDPFREMTVHALKP